MADATVVIRRVAPADHARVGQVLTAAYAPSGMLPDDPYLEDLCDVAGRDAEAEVWVAEASGAVVRSSATWMTAAHRLYESLGFARAPELDWKPRPDVDLLAYRLTL